MPKQCYSQYYKVCRTLRKELGMPKSLSIRRVKMKDYDGYCYKWRNRTFIRIDKSLTEDAAIETLIHEMGHALQTSFWGKFCKAKASDQDRMLDKAHDSEWGRNYAKVYSIYERNFT